ncbi:MAG: D-2-hydroxyacid dehydrogenase [Sheuella sp.]|nr:D-2-hydroxyacid dehydrogenase [Sheuella sp.]
MNMTKQAPRILLSEHTARELAPQLTEIFGPGGYTQITASDIHAGTADADICFVSREITGNSTKQNILPDTQYFYDALRASKTLRWIQVHSAGADRQVFLDLIARGVTLTTSSGASASLVAQTALTGLLSLSRRFPQLAAAQRAHIWAPFFKTGLPPDLEGQTALIVGWGPIGQKLGAWLGALGLNIIVVRQSAQSSVEGARVIGFSDFATNLPQADWLVLACPLTTQTTNLVSEYALSLMKPSAHIINISRGAVIDEPAMIDALTNGRLAGAYLDVFAQEPLAAESPLWDLPNVIATPHTAGFSDGILQRMSQMFIQNLKNWQADTPLFNVVNK